ncbi:MAG: HD domain-containing protein [Candidatus Pacebacteria bacterium]|nr:HD domain-containing protein [Candidatus Paceibacterota bacterium]
MENLNLTSQQAKELVDKYISDPVTRFHLRETEVFMRNLAKKFNEDEEAWGIIGLLHDIDWSITKDNPSEHCIKSQEILKNAGASDFLIETISSHGYGLKEIPYFLEKQRSNNLQHCLAASETLTGLIVAAALVQPDKKLQSVSLESLNKKFKNKAFAAKCNRDIILECEKAGIPLEEFLQIGLFSLQAINEELGL